MKYENVVMKKWRSIFKSRDVFSAVTAGTEQASPPAGLFLAPSPASGHRAVSAELWKCLPAAHLPAGHRGARGLLFFH